MTARIGVALALAAALGALVACAPAEPRIESIVPRQKATGVPTDTDIRIAFDRAVDRASVERRLKMDPPPPGCAAGGPACRLVWDQNSLVLVHDENLLPSTRYTVRLASGFTDTAGHANNLDHQWEFLTEAPPAVTGLEPAPQATGVSPARDLTLTFSRAMRPESVAAAVRLTPAAALRVIPNPSNPAQFQVAPVRVLQARTEYTLEIPFAVQDIHSNAMAASVRSTFTTGEVGFPAMVSYLAAVPAGGSANTVGMADPHANPVAGRVLPKVVFQEPADSSATLLDFWWMPDGKSLILLRRLPSGDGLFAYDLAAGRLRDLGVRASVAALAPDGSRLVYIQDGALRSLGLADGRDRLLAGGDALAVAPVFSPDGKTLAYLAATDGVPRVHLHNLAIDTRYRIPDVNDATDSPAWAPDGEKIAFRRWRSGKASLWLFFMINAPGPRQSQVADADLEQMTWLDSSTIIGVTRQGNQPGLLRVNASSPGEAAATRRLTRPETVPAGDEPQVPSYDRRVAFRSPAQGRSQVSQVWVMNADGSSPLQLTHAEDGLSASQPKWTPKPAALAPR